ncbi:MAG: VOC family protein [Acidimicrobiales bacterium]
MATIEPPAPYRTVTPRVFVDDVEAAVGFLQTVFDATGNLQPGRPTDVQVGDSVIMVSSTAEREAFPSFLYIYVENADVCYQLAIEAGATSIEAPLNTPYGDRRAMFSDAFGNIYQVAHRLHTDAAAAAP